MLIVTFLILGAVVGAGYWFWQKRELANRREVVSQRQAEATRLEAIIKEVDDFQKRRDNLQQRIDLINQLKQNQKGPVRILDQISRDLPDLVWLDKMTINGQNIAVSGRGLNPNAIANFVENIKKDAYFEEPAVAGLTQVSVEPTVYSFDMTFNFTHTPKNADGTPGTTTTTATTATGTTGTPARQ